MTTDTAEQRVTQREAALGQFDRRYIRAAAARILLILGFAENWGGCLTRSDLQIRMAWDILCLVIYGQLGREVEDGMPEPVGDLRQRAIPGLPTSLKLLLEGNEN